MTSIEKQNNDNQIEIEAVVDNKQQTPVITFVEGLSGTLYRNESCGNGIPDKLLCD